jgi:hypothetical protein
MDVDTHVPESELVANAIINFLINFKKKTKTIMSKETQVLKNKTREYIALLKNKTTQELTSLRDRLSEKFKAERLKPSPDKRLLHDYNIQLSLIGRELKSRLPIHKQGDNFHAVESDMRQAKSFEETLKDKSLDELKAMLVVAEKELSDFKETLAGSRMTAEAMDANKVKMEAMSAKVDAIKAEIDTRDEKASDEAKDDLKGRAGEFFSNVKPYLAPAIAGGVIVGVIGHAFGKNVLGFGLIGVGIGAGIVWLTKNANTSKVVTTP